MTTRIIKAKGKFDIPAGEMCAKLSECLRQGDGSLGLGKAEVLIVYSQEYITPVGWSIKIFILDKFVACFTSCYKSCSFALLCQCLEDVIAFNSVRV